MTHEKATTLLPFNAPNLHLNNRSISRYINGTILRKAFEVIFTACGVFLLLLVLNANISKRSQLHLPTSLSDISVLGTANDGPSWPTDGWDGIKNIFAFGDSYSDTGFDPYKAQPSPDNPFGNPDWASKLTAGSVWLHFLGLQYNASTPSDSSDRLPTDIDNIEAARLNIYNLAIGGSTIDPKVITPYHGRKATTFTAQLHDTFLLRYASSPEFALWRPNNTLFVLWFGINDIIVPSYNLKYPPLPALLSAYLAHWETLYEHGARNYLILDVPPIYKAHPTASYASFEASAVLNFNMQLNATVLHFRSKHSDVTLFAFSTHRLWSEVLEAPGVFEATRQLARLEQPCPAYMKLPANVVPDYMVEECDVSVDEYFWLNGLHATYAVHNLTAEMVVRDCFGEGGPTGFCEL